MRRLWRAYVRAGAMKEDALRRFMPSRMRFVHYSWPLRPTVCPCDVDFCAYLLERNVRQASIFHFGSGGHHIVGLRNHDAGLQNDILALTLAPPEHSSYVARVIRDPGLGKHYKVLFADIYSLGAATLPAFDIVTLFHLCEFADDRSAGRRLNDAQVLALFTSKLVAGGLLMLYPGSYGFSRVTPLAAQLVSDGRISLLEKYRSLLVYQAPRHPPLHSDSE